MTTPKTVNPLVFFLHRDDRRNRQQITGVYQDGLATWDLETGRFLEHHFDRDFDKSEIRNFEDDNPVFFKFVGKNDIEVWDIRTRQQVSLIQKYDPWTYGYATSQDRSKIVGLSHCNTDATKPRLIRVWEAKSGKTQHELTWVDVRDPIRLYACLTPDGQKLFCGNGRLWTGQAVIRGWDLTTGKECFSAISTETKDYMVEDGERYPTTHGVCALKTNRDGRLLIAVLYEGVVKIWSTSSGALLWEYPLFDRRYLSEGVLIAVSPNDKLLFCQCPKEEYHGQSTCGVIELETGTVLKRGNMHYNPVAHIAFSEDSEIIVTSTLRGTTNVNQWDWQRSPYPKPLLLESPDFHTRI
ncbi:MAG: WD40 repeat domain-containing protein [Pseudanabaenaceae cyanobacterium bins.39]|nr:WD40 repeat domain-containing protein [Pseudanabaenaceae cyanobacterium bins.39]